MTRYRTIVADPPWRYQTTLAVTGNAPGRTRQCGRSGAPYPAMTLNEIAALPIQGLAAPGAHLYLWTTNTHLEHSWRLVRGWGFEPKTVLVWCKPPKGMIGFGAFSVATEFVLFAGGGYASRCERTWFEWPRGAHSAKPDAFYDLVEQVSPGPYAELFARRARLGWDYPIGNEALGGVAA